MMTMIRLKPNKNGMPANMICVYTMAMSIASSGVSSSSRMPGENTMPSAPVITDRMKKKLVLVPTTFFAS